MFIKSKTGAFKITTKASIAYFSHVILKLANLRIYNYFEIQV